MSVLVRVPGTVVQSTGIESTVLLATVRSIRGKSPRGKTSSVCLSFDRIYGMRNSTAKNHSRSTKSIFRRVDDARDHRHHSIFSYNYYSALRSSHMISILHPFFSLFPHHHHHDDETQQTPLHCESHSSRWSSRAVHPGRFDACVQFANQICGYDRNSYPTVARQYY